MEEEDGEPHPDEYVPVGLLGLPPHGDAEADAAARQAGGMPDAHNAAIGRAQQQIMAEMRATAAMGEDGLGLGG